MGNSEVVTPRPLWSSTRRAGLIAFATSIALLVRRLGPPRDHLLGESVVFAIQYMALAAAGVQLLRNRGDEGGTRERYGDLHGSASLSALATVTVCVSTGSLMLLLPWKLVPASTAWTVLVLAWLLLGIPAFFAACNGVYEGGIGVLDDRRKTRSLAALTMFALLIAFTCFRFANVEMPSFDAIRLDRCFHPRIK